MSPSPFMQEHVSRLVKAVRREKQASSSELNSGATINAASEDQLFPTNSDIPTDIDLGLPDKRFPVRPCPNVSVGTLPKCSALELRSRPMELLRIFRFPSNLDRCPHADGFALEDSGIAGSVAISPKRTAVQLVSSRSIF